MGKPKCKSVACSDERVLDTASKAINQGFGTFGRIAKRKVTMTGRNMKFETALAKSREGYFEFVYDARKGAGNLIRYQTPSGKWKQRYISLD